jgi:hypothetical protein
MDIDDLEEGRFSKPGKPLLFSRNVVCVDLEGPDLTDLSFIDLPGVSVVFSPLSPLTSIHQRFRDNPKR